MNTGRPGRLLDSSPNSKFTLESCNQYDCAAYVKHVFLTKQVYERTFTKRQFGSVSQSGSVDDGTSIIDLSHAEQ